MSRTIRIGVKCPTSGPLAAQRGISSMSRALEEAGFESLWTGDHVILPTEIITPRGDHPGEGDFWRHPNESFDTTIDWFDPIVSMAVMVSATSTIDIGVSCLVLPYREPIVTAKMLASIDIESGGRLNGLALCAGWLAQEFQILGVPFKQRGSMLDEGIAVMRSCWKGEVEPFRGRHYQLPPGALAYPAPGREIPLLIAGNSTHALRRAASLPVCGWNPVRRADQLSLETVAEGAAQMHRAAEEMGRPADALRVVLRISDSSAPSSTETIARAWDSLASAGVTEVIVDTNWNSDNHRWVYERLLEADQALQVS